MVNIRVGASEVHKQYPTGVGYAVETPAKNLIDMTNGAPIERVSYHQYEIGHVHQPRLLIYARAGVRRQRAKGDLNRRDDLIDHDRTVAVAVSDT